MTKGITRVMAAAALMLLLQYTYRDVPTTSPNWRELVVLVTMLLIGWLLVTGLARLSIAAVTGSRHASNRAVPVGLGAASAARARRPGDPAATPLLEQVARHEAAHAVAVLVLGHTLLEASTEADRERQSGGHVKWILPDTPSVDQVVVCVIGHLAEPRLTDYRQGGLNDDLQAALRASLSVAMATGGSPSTVLDAALEKAREILVDHAHDVETLAAQLNQKPITLTGDKVRSILGFQPSDTRVT